MTARRAHSAALAAVIALAAQLGGCSGAAVEGRTAALGPGSVSVSVSVSGPPSVTAREAAATSSAAPAAPAAPTTKAAPAAPRPPDPMTVLLSRLTLEQRVGQLFMVGGPAKGVGRATRSAITRYHVGSVMLTGRSAAGVAATARVSADVRSRATRAATGSVPVLVATDQEGGAVQVLRGPGFTRLPSALAQGRLSPATLRARSAGWARALRAAGIDLDLAPVADTVPSAAVADANAPIGRFDRQFGYRPQTVASHTVAFVQGMTQAGVATTVKHFPGLGRVTGNTDVSSGVTDRATTRHDAYLGPFRQAVQAGVPFVMMSTATYSRIDPARPAAFSPVVIGAMLRGDLGFRGVVVSDDLGRARQVASVRPGDRAVRFVAAGGDLVLTVDPSVLPAMYGAVLHRARSDPAFRAQVDAAARRVLRAKVQVERR